jgi:site-specific recombinase XerD
MGHADIKTTQIYTDYEPRNEEELEAMASAFSEVRFKP